MSEWILRQNVMHDKTTHKQRAVCVSVCVYVCVLVQVGDRIVNINGQSVDGLSHGDVVTMLKNSYGNISLQVTLWVLWPVSSAGM